MADATATLKQITASLDQFAMQTIAALGPHQASFMELWGWNMPGLTGQDLADYIRSPIKIVNRIDATSFNDADVGPIDGLSSQSSVFNIERSSSNSRWKCS